MGYWGTEIFDSDHALCSLGELVDPFVDLIEKHAANPEATSQWDETNIDELVISSGILMTLVEAEFPIETLPDSKILKKHRSSFIKQWRKNAEGNEFQLARLAKIIEVWDQMIKVSKAHEKRHRQQGV